MSLRLELVPVWGGLCGEGGKRVREGGGKEEGEREGRKGRGEGEGGDRRRGGGKG